jgi:deoxyuridine 5'-triphosphate nucleotidohydrolase
MNNKIRFTKIRDVKSPSYRVGDAGSDFYVPNKTQDFLDALLKKNIEELDNDIWVEGDEIVIGPHSQILIPCGIKVDILDKNTYLDAENKSGIATKKELLVGAQVVDAIYQGEVHINLHNVSDKRQRIGFGTKAVQFLHKEYIQTIWEEISNEEYDAIEASERGAGGFSSTGLN